MIGTKLEKKKQRKIRESNVRENKNRIDIWYKKGDLILIKKPGIIRKLSIPYAGPYKVVTHRRNGSIKYEKSLNIYETVNIRRVIPFYKESTDREQPSNDAE